MIQLLRHFGLYAVLLLMAACSLNPTERPVPVERRSPPPDSAPSERADRAPVESRLPPPATDVRTQPPVGETEPAKEEPIQAPAKRSEQPQASSAVVALLETARQQAANGQDEQAAANLERALRIEPKNPWLWHRLGVLRLQQGDYRAAIDLANKSNALAAGNRRLMAGNWELLARAYNAQGRDAEAERARDKARELQQPSRG